MKGYEKKKTSLEQMYDWGMANLPPRKYIDKETQIELAYAINEIKKYSLNFSYFPGINIFEHVKFISETAKRLNAELDRSNQKKSEEPQ